MTDFNFIDKNKISDFPSKTGVYALAAPREILYIGKAVNIKSRVKSHLKKNSYRDELFVDKVKRVGWQETNSEIEALVLESNLIKKHQPKHNVLWRDDKNYFYVGTTKEKTPQVFLTHQPNLKKKKNQAKVDYIGPFIDGKAIRTTLRALRRIFPYYSRKNHPKKQCPYCHIGLCPGPNPNLKKYKKDLSKLKQILKGGKRSVLKKLEKEMKQLSENQNYERAAKIRDQINALKKIMSHARVIKNYSPARRWSKIKKELRQSTNKKGRINKVEAYDVSNIQGKEATGSMVTFWKGQPDKKMYRKFKIKTSGKPNDTAMIKEIIKRRLNHPEWNYPDLMLIDGGKGQLNAAVSELKIIKKNKNIKKKIKVLSLAKKENKLFAQDRKKYFSLSNLSQETSNFILHIRDESHRFAVKYHRQLRRRKVFN